jgi:type IV secretion system protein VirB10
LNAFKGVRENLIMVGGHMRAATVLLVAFLSAATIIVSAQARDDSPQLTSRAVPIAQENSPAAPADAITVPAGTRVPLTMKQGLTTKNARPGDPVYAQTAFPIVMNDRIVIPPGTFVQGEIRRVLRPGKVKGRAELQMSFTSMIFPNGYTLLLPGAVQGTPGDPNTAGVKDKEGTIQGDSSKGKDVGTIVGTAIPGAGIGAIAGGSKAAGIGAASGGALGLATVLFTRGPEIQLGVGDSIEMVLERSLTIDETRARRAAQ